MMDRGESSLLRIIKKECLSVFRLRLIFELILSIEGFILLIIINYLSIIIKITSSNFSLFTLYLIFFDKNINSINNSNTDLIRSKVNQN